ncbi:variant erythrocyte surface antigen-1 family protein [Babesia caballi]|uniref:Variant erythrocyte surface antigen-1 family protein n=1 Tax=Babesia caballi TaxID=5871 RepID=A0AAV4LWC3_BABCB|nr:variant erythrocyte surface antigen-1 family protein [Babesia caballi]
MVLYSPMLTPLTDWPDTLKDVIDWFLRMGEMDKGGSGLGKGMELQSAVKALTDYGDASSVLKADSTGGLFKAVAEGLRVFIGYNESGDHDLTGDGIGLSSHGRYASSYKTEATWTWNNDSDPQSKICAHILLGSFPLLYFGLTYLLGGA